MRLSPISLAITRLGRTAAPDAAIKALFAAGEQGVWYDPSDLSTMFQDSAGTTPVTADGQQVGLILDKSKGLALGSELIVNGDFSNGSANWSVGSEWTISSGACSVVGVGSFTNLQQGAGTVAGKTYCLTFNVLAISGGPLRIACGGSAQNQSITTTGSKTLYLVAAVSGSWFVRVQVAGGVSATIDNISVKEVSGNHAYQATAAARPLYKVTGLCKWNDFDAVDDVLNTTFQSALGSSCTVARGNVGAAPTILTGQTIGTSYANSTDNCGLIIVNRALTSQETTDLTAWLTAKGATA